MKITIEIDDREITEAVKATVIRNAVQSVEEKLFKDDYGNYDRRMYRDAIKEAVRETVKKNAGDIVDRGTAYAGEYIGKKGLKKMIDDGTI
ncbi:MAG: hypothetical protein IKI84_01200 [Clostridia bacterium]|nr:hypothetical protein [Clostridia bacterium]